jgi:tRNA threonylcarbamoyladenosine biosynthesis protein TsaE
MKRLCQSQQKDSIMPSTERPEGQCELTIGSLADLDRFTAALAAALPATALVTLEGDLGAGKTTLVKAVAAAVGIDPATVTSPTFGLIHLHDTADGSLRIVHADMYRLSDVSELHELGWEDAIAVAPGCRCWAFVEWAQRIGPALPAERLNISLTITGETSRRLTLTGVGDQYTTIPQAFLERPTCD